MPTTDALKITSKEDFETQVKEIVAPEVRKIIKDEYGIEVKALSDRPSRTYLTCSFPAQFNGSLRITPEGLLDNNNTSKEGGQLELDFLNCDKGLSTLFIDVFEDKFRLWSGYGNPTDNQCDHVDYFLVLPGPNKNLSP